ncbi:FAD-dependent oxidoreductase [Nocardioides sp. cx-173]|uniref:oxidoreductase n=1 Tax=Nocardioides sp. cx-173 TaxID=2898796 RepID=UPI001E2A0188|nr:FAD-dependent oxidoreductase [Nocardioides sp. cx-173]MCD4524258.1 FAD-dependent oxidoreductase [Nocardioides sp. cx-173]UGB41650.1 FAD-dependent oxidoreductase [Nocardioides sp. cx-173]
MPEQAPGDPDHTSLYPHALSPITINGCELKNRIVRAAHGTGLVGGGMGPRFLAFHEARAKGGVAMFTLEASPVHPSSLTRTGGEGMAAYLDATRSGWEEVLRRAHPHGTKVFQQLWHGGAVATPRGGGRSWAPSEVAEPSTGRLPLAMTKGMIDEVVESFAKAAATCRDVGLDGIEIHGGHGYLISQFLSPLNNHREDEYGGSLENRTRFIREILAAVRSEAGADFPLGLRMSATEEAPGGVEPADAAEIARGLEAAGLIDFLNLSIGSYYPSDLGTAAGMHAPHGYELPYSAQVAAAVSVPTMVIGRITTLAEAERIVADGIADLVSMVRATIADAELVSKSAAGLASAVRPCIGCNQGCLTASVGCTVNPRTGHEAEPAFTPAAASKSVLVVGAGPAGLEAALVAAQRGHRVTVHEAGDGPGGLTRAARRAPFRAEIGAYCDFQAGELARLGVETRYGSRVDPALVRREAPDVVVVATGSAERRDGIQRLRPLTPVPGHGLPHVVTPVDVLSGSVPVGRQVVIVDDIGNAPALSVAEYLLAEGAEVVYATCERVVGATSGSLQSTTYGRLAKSAGFTEHVRVVVEEIAADRVRLRNLDTDECVEVVADQVVLFTGFRPERSLHDELVAAGLPSFLVGDAEVPLQLDFAIGSGSRLGASL